MDAAARGLSGISHQWGPDRRAARYGLARFRSDPPQSRDVRRPRFRRCRPRSKVRRAIDAGMPESATGYSFDLKLAGTNEIRGVFFTPAGKGTVQLKRQ